MLNKEGGLDEAVLDSILMAQKDKLLARINRLESTRDKEKFVFLVVEIKASLIILCDLWAAANYNYKAEELLERINHIRKTHKHGHLL